jgi:hypothetical protein
MARGNLAAARQAITEAVEMVLQAVSLGHALGLVSPALRLLPDELARTLLELLTTAGDDPGDRVRRLHAQALLGGHQSLFAEAADIYRELRLPYQEGTCRIAAGQLDRARELVLKHGLERGPLGIQLRAAADGSITPPGRP